MPPERGFTPDARVPIVLAYVESDMPPDMTIADYRAQQVPRPQRPALRRWLPPPWRR